MWDLFIIVWRLARWSGLAALFLILRLFLIIVSRLFLSIRIWFELLCYDDSYLLHLYMSLLDPICISDEL